MGSVNSQDARGPSHFFWGIAPVLLVFLPMCSYLLCNFHLARRRGKYGYETTAVVVFKSRGKNDTYMLHYRYRYDRTEYVLTAILTRLLFEADIDLPEEMKLLIKEWVCDEPMFWYTINVRENVLSRAFASVTVGEEIKIRVDADYVLSFQTYLNVSDNAAAIWNVQPGWHLILYAVYSIFALVPAVSLYYYLISPYILEKSKGLMSEILLESLLILALLLWIVLVTLLFVHTQRYGMFFIGTRPELQMKGLETNSDAEIVEVKDFSISNIQF